MGDLHLFALSSERVAWLGARQRIVAENIANADTPGFRAKDIVTFQSFLESAAASQRSGEVGRQRASAHVEHSGNSVNVESELVKAAEISGFHNLTTTVLKSFHKMMLMSARG